MTAFDLSHLVHAAHAIQTVWESEGIQFCFIGGLAVHHWGEVRMTQDVDATVLTGFGNEQAIIERLWHSLTPRVADATAFAKLNRVLLGQSPEGVPIDVSLSGLPYEEQVIGRSQLQEYAPSRSLRICAASDLVILKAFANRPRDWQDIRGILIRSASHLDWNLIDTELHMLSDLKDEPEILDKLHALRSESQK